MSYDHDDIDTLKAALIGRSVTAVQVGGELQSPSSYTSAEGKVVLDDGTELVFGGNVGGCSCGAGDYSLTLLNAMPINGITNVEIVADGHDEHGESFTYRIFVLAHDERFELAAFDGDDGNGYYGTGFWFTVHEGAR